MCSEMFELLTDSLCLLCFLPLSVCPPPDNNVIILVVCGIAALVLVVIMGLVMKYKLKRDNGKSSIQVLYATKKEKKKLCTCFLLKNVIKGMAVIWMIGSYSPC